MRRNIFLLVIGIAVSGLNYAQGQGCTIPAGPANGSHDGTEGGTTADGATLTFSCDSGYTINGDAVLTCTTGAFNPTTPPTCEADCTDPGAAPANGGKTGSDYSHGSSVTYTCDTGYTLSGSGVLICTSGSWDNQVPTCNADDCTNPGDAPTNGRKTGTDYTHESTVTYTCDDRYTLSGPGVLTCTAGSWDNEVPTCNADCADPGPAPANGTKTGDDYKHGASVTYACDEGFTLSGSGTLTCNDGSWDNALPICSAPSTVADDPTGGSDTTSALRTTKKSDGGAGTACLNLSMLLSLLLAVLTFMNG